MSACIARCAQQDVDAKLHVWEAAGHGGVLGMAPEDADRYAELRRFAERHWTAATEIIDSARPEKTWRPPPRPRNSGTLPCTYESGCRDLNPGPSVPQTDALTKLRHSPFHGSRRAGQCR
jgi:hypothetical protein